MTTSNPASQVIPNAVKLGFRAGTAQAMIIDALLAGDKTEPEIVKAIAAATSKEESSVKTTVNVFLSDLQADPKVSKYPAARGMALELVNDKNEVGLRTALPAAARKTSKVRVTTKAFEEAVKRWDASAKNPKNAKK